MDSNKKKVDIFSQEIRQTTQLQIISFNQKQIKYLLVKNELATKKQSNKIYRIQMKQCNKEMVINKVFDYFGRFTVKKLIINLSDNNIKSQIQFDMIKSLHFEEIKILGNKSQINSKKNQTKQVDQIKIEGDKQSKIFKQEEQFQVINVLDRILESKISYQILSIEIYGVLDQLILIRERLGKHEFVLCNQSNKQFKNEEIKDFVALRQHHQMQQNHTSNQQVTSTRQTKKLTQSYINNKCNQRKYNFLIDIDQKYQTSSILSFLHKWLLNNLSKDTNQYKTSGQKNINNMESPISSKLNESITINIKEQKILYLKSSQLFGLQIHCNKQQTFSTEQFKSILIYLSYCQRQFVTLHLQYIPQSLLQIVNSIFQTLKYHKKHLIKIHGHLEITYNSITINSKNLTQQIIHHLLKLVQQNHNIYSFIFYGSTQYLPEITQLFTKRPFIKFNCFVPIAQITPESHAIIKKMEILSQDLKRKAIQFHAMLKYHTPLQINLIKDVFMTLHMKDYN